MLVIGAKFKLINCKGSVHQTVTIKIFTNKEQKRQTNDKNAS